MADKKRILFLCTGNSCRSQMAEAMLRQLGGDRFESLSAGFQPAGFIHPLAIDAMQALDVPMEDLISKSWDEFAETKLDLILTLCDAAAAEPCPRWPGSPLTVHWPIPDPAYHMGTDRERVAFAHSVAERLRTKVQGLVDLDWSVSRGELRKKLELLGEI